jgi:hypothetical protein
MRDGHAPRKRAQEALVTYLRLLAACIEDEAEMIETDPVRAEEVLRRFRDGVLGLSLEDAPLDALFDRIAGTPEPAVEEIEVRGSSTPRTTPAN